GHGPCLFRRRRLPLVLVPQVERWGARAHTFPVDPQSVVLGIRSLLFLLLRGLGHGGLRLPLRASEFARLVMPRLPFALPLDLCLRRVLPPFHLLRMEAIDQTLFRDRGLRDTAPQPLQSTPEMESEKEGYTTHAKFEAKTYQRNVPRLGAHLGPPEILGILGEIRHRVLHPSGGSGVGEKLASRPRAFNLAP